MSLEITNIDYVNDFSEFSYEYDNFIFFHGEALDIRGKSIINLVECSTNSFSITFNPEKNTITIDNEEIVHFKLKDFIESLNVENILIESTTLSIAEILLLLHAINLCEKEFEINIIYLEPEEYKIREDSKNMNEFDLSSHLEGFYNIRPYNLLIDSTNKEEFAEVIVLLGFEDNRLGQLLEDEEGQKYKSYVPLLGLPAFQPGWENISLTRNIRHFNNGFNKIECAGASNPYQTMKVIEKIYQNSSYKKILIAAFGTKPAAIGASLFLVNNFKVEENNVGIIYDFPKKNNNRTLGTGKVYQYTIYKY